ncbi:DUF4367 domain-containing protein [Massiliimalia timonensis]|mgnify:CR=1 FL=1|uniref:DUF4367 domain-containing protein n=1 Tax=Massiliimalia timonensis TaxID=1987501 RepID=UPI000B8AFA96|nr:DUF4367 domain-containing protein [Massiliimalia timonensis]MBS7176709.1 DUF4367 domain-containing protein [Clostridiales bacterium]
MDKYISERLMKAACISAFRTEDLSIGLPAEKHTFSKKFQRKMKRVIRKADQTAASYIPMVRWKAVLIMVLAVLLSISITVMAVEPLREGFFRMIRSVFSDHTELSFEAESSISNTKEGFQIFQFGYIPKEFHVVDEQNLSEVDFYSISYSDDSEHSFEIIQLLPQDANLNIGSKDNKYEEFVINDMNAYYNEDQVNNNLVLYNDEYVITISGNIPKEELINIAKSAKL